MITFKENAQKLLNDEEYDYSFINNSKYHYLAVTESNALLAKFLWKRDRDRFYLNCFSNFQSHKKLKEHEKSPSCLIGSIW